MRKPISRLAFPISALCAAAVFGVGVAAAAYTAGPAVDVSPTTDPFATCTADNVALQETFDTLYPLTEPEPRAAINPTNSSNIVAAYHEDRWAGGGDRGLVSSATFDGGTSWSQTAVPGITKCSGGGFDRASDPWVTFDPNGKLYGIWLVFDVFDSHNGVLASTSSDGGASWSQPTPVLVDNTGGDDKQSITADPYNPGYVYAVWDRFLSPPGSGANDHGRFHAKSFVQQTWFSRTTNSGASWEPARVAYNPGTQSFTIGNIVSVLPNQSHDLVDGFIQGSQQGGKVRSATVSVIRSSDQGATWSKKATTIAPLDITYPGPFDPDNGNPIRSGGLPDFAVDSNSGTMYAVWEDDAPTPGIDAIQFSQSTDGGHSWSTPVKINQTPTNITPADQQAFTPTIKVASDGTVGVTYYDLRHNTTAAGLPTDEWFVHCSATCTNTASWTETHVAGPSDLEQAPFAGGYFFGDYEGLVTNGTTFGSIFDQSTGTSSNPTDVYYAPITP
jgi:hypothetical protein